MILSAALSLSLGEVPEPVLTRYRLGLIVFRLYLEKSYQGESLPHLTLESAGPAEFSRCLSELQGTGILKSHPDFPERVFRLLGRRDEDPAEVACTVDPFCYVSHLSAMAHHGLTDRIPAKLFLSSPPANIWKEEAASRMRQDLGEDFPLYEESGMPLLTRPRLSKINRVDIHVFHSKHRGAYKNVKGSTLRISTLGRTFLDMLRNPELCGGMHHVIAVYRDHAPTYLRLIVDELEQHGAPIDKVRAGYLLDEYLDLRNDTVESWVRHAQRGGSRKLDASAEYRPVWSDKWALSLNVEGLKGAGAA
jgi:predicted transcriptional regulator of viral defense system